MAKHVAKFSLKRETKNTGLYEEIVDGQMVIGQQYIQKAILPKPLPVEITITVEYADA